MYKWLIVPPVAFIIIFCSSWLIARLLSRLAYRPKKAPEGSKEAYACGENNYDQSAQPDYSNFFPFAFFFTLAHVATLIMTTVPTFVRHVFVIAGIYITGAILGLYILFRRR